MKSCIIFIVMIFNTYFFKKKHKLVMVVLSYNSSKEDQDLKAVLGYMVNLRHGVCETVSHFPNYRFFKQYCLV